MSNRGINKVIVIGNVGKTIELTHTPGGKAICNFSVATTDAWKDKQTGEEREETEWHQIVTFGNLAEIAKKHLTTGMQVYIEGQNKTSRWKDDNQNDRNKTEVVAKVIQFLGKKATP